MPSRRAFLAGAATAGVLSGLGGLPVARAATTLRLNPVAPKTHFFTIRVMGGWTEAVQKATNGSVVIEAAPAALGQYSRAFDLVQSGVADISPGDHGAIPGRFPVTSVVELPVLGGTGELVSAALWRLNERYLGTAGEHAGVKLLGLNVTAPFHFFTATKTLERIEDVKGLKLVVTGPTSARIATALGATPVNVPVTQWYEMISRGVADELIATQTSIIGWKLIEHVKHQLEIPGGLLWSSQFLAMNQGKWDALTEAERTQMMSVSGEVQSRRAGAIFGEEDGNSAAQIKAAGVTVSQASPAFMTELKSISDQIAKEWLVTAKEKGVDGEAALAFFREQVAAKS